MQDAFVSGFSSGTKVWQKDLIYSRSPTSDYFNDNSELNGNQSEDESSSDTDDFYYEPIQQEFAEDDYQHCLWGAVHDPDEDFLGRDCDGVENEEWDREEEERQDSDDNTMERDREAKTRQVISAELSSLKPEKLVAVPPIVQVNATILSPDVDLDRGSNDALKKLLKNDVFGPSQESSVSSRPESHIYASIDPYNLSTASGSEKAHSQVKQFPVKHARPAELLEVFKTHIKNRAFEHFHRPRLHIEKRQGRKIDFVASSSNRKCIGNNVDLSGASGKVILVEYAQLYPPVIQQRGMCSGIRNYKLEGSQSKRFVYGADYFLDDKTESPFKVEMLPLVRSLENNLFRCPLYEHPPPTLPLISKEKEIEQHDNRDVNSSDDSMDLELEKSPASIASFNDGSSAPSQDSQFVDFLVVLPKKRFGEVGTIRECNTAFLAGRMLFHNQKPETIPEPLTTNAQSLQTKRLVAFISSLVKKNDVVERSDLQNAFPLAKDYELRVQLKRVGLTSQNSKWIRPPGVTSEELKLKTITPEKVCILESCLWGVYRAARAGLGRFFTSQHITMGRDVQKVLKNSNVAGKIKETVDILESVIFSLPWSVTQRKDQGKSHRDKKKKSQGDKCDYRVFMMNDLKFICEGLGIPVEHKMRWELVKAIKKKCNDLSKDKAPEIEAYRIIKKLVREQRGPKEAQRRVEIRSKYFKTEYDIIAGRNFEKTVDESELAEKNELTEEKEEEEEEEEEEQETGQKETDKQKQVKKVIRYPGVLAYVDSDEYDRIKKSVGKFVKSTNAIAIPEEIKPRPVSVTPTRIKPVSLASPEPDIKPLPDVFEPRVISESHRRSQRSKLNRFLQTIISHVEEFPLFAAFVDPVRSEDVNDYKIFVRKSVALQTLSKKCKKSHYHSRKSFFGAVQRLVENCIAYNNPVFGGLRRNTTLIANAYLLRDCIYNMLFNHAANLEYGSLESADDDEYESESAAAPSVSCSKFTIKLERKLDKDDVLIHRLEKYREMESTKPCTVKNNVSRPVQPHKTTSVLLHQHKVSFNVPVLLAACKEHSCDPLFLAFVENELHKNPSELIYRDGEIQEDDASLFSLKSQKRMVKVHFPASVRVVKFSRFYCFSPERTTTTTTLLPARQQQQQQQQQQQHNQNGKRSAPRKKHFVYHQPESVVMPHVTVNRSRQERNIKILPRPAPAAQSLEPPSEVPTPPALVIDDVRTSPTPPCVEGAPVVTLQAPQARRSTRFVVKRQQNK